MILRTMLLARWGLCLLGAMILVQGCGSMDGIDEGDFILLDEGKAEFTSSTTKVDCDRLYLAHAFLIPLMEEMNQPYERATTQNPVPEGALAIFVGARATQFADWGCGFLLLDSCVHYTGTSQIYRNQDSHQDSGFIAVGAQFEATVSVNSMDAEDSAEYSEANQESKILAVKKALEGTCRQHYKKPAAAEVDHR